MVIFEVLIDFGDKLVFDFDWFIWFFWFDFSRFVLVCSIWRLEFLCIKLFIKDGDVEVLVLLLFLLLFIVVIGFGLKFIIWVNILVFCILNLLFFVIFIFFWFIFLEIFLLFFLEFVGVLEIIGFLFGYVEFL